MKILYIDPGLSTSRGGHNLSFLNEFENALVKERNNRLVILSHNGFKGSDCPNLLAEVKPIFRINGYLELPTNLLGDQEKLKEIYSLILEDFQQVDLRDFDLILMPTAYPLYINPVAKILKNNYNIRIIVGMILSGEVWCTSSDDAKFYNELLYDGIIQLYECGKLFCYSETGVFKNGNSVIDMPTLLPPLAKNNYSRLLELSVLGEFTCNKPVIGFFGNCFSNKGFNLLIKSIELMSNSGVIPNLNFIIRIPPGNEAICSYLNGIAPWVNALSKDLNNQEYLEEMAKVDLVWAFYSPEYYKDRMSGIVPEALALGKVLLLSDGCTAIRNFVNRYAPSSFLSGRYSIDTIIHALNLEKIQLQKLKRNSYLNAPIVQNLKSMDRYLSLCGLD